MTAGKISPEKAVLQYLLYFEYFLTNLNYYSYYLLIPSLNFFMIDFLFNMRKQYLFHLLFLTTSPLIFILPTQFPLLGHGTRHLVQRGWFFYVVFLAGVIHLLFFPSDYVINY